MLVSLRTSTGAAAPEIMRVHTPVRRRVQHGLLFLVPILTKTFLAFVSADLLFLPLPSTRHNKTSLLVFY
jgi:hypothetical protein